MINVDREQLLAWWSPAVDPLIDAIYAKDTELGHLTIHSIQRNLPRSGLTRDQQQAATFKLGFVSNQFYRIIGSKSVSQASNDTIACLSEPSVGPVSESIRCQLMIQVKTVAEINAAGHLTEGDFEQLFNNVEADYRTPEFWHHVSSWGFMHNRVEYVKQALAELTVSSDGYQSDLLWQRVNLIHLLMEGRAREKDLIELLKRIENELQLSSIKHLLWPAIKAAGLLESEEVKLLIGRKEEQIKTNPVEIPRRDLPTKGLRK